MGKVRDPEESLGGRGAGWGEDRAAARGAQAGAVPAPPPRGGRRSGVGRLHPSPPALIARPPASNGVGRAGAGGLERRVRVRVRVHLDSLSGGAPGSPRSLVSLGRRKEGEPGKPVSPPPKCRRRERTSPVSLAISSVGCGATAVPSRTPLCPGAVCVPGGPGKGAQSRRAPRQPG